MTDDHMIIFENVHKLLDNLRQFKNSLNMHFELEDLFERAFQLGKIRNKVLYKTLASNKPGYLQACYA